MSTYDSQSIGGNPVYHSAAGVSEDDIQAMEKALSGCPENSETQTESAKTSEDSGAVPLEREEAMSSQEQINYLVREGLMMSILNNRIELEKDE